MEACMVYQCAVLVDADREKRPVKVDENMLTASGLKDWWKHYIYYISIFEGLTDKGIG